MEMVSFSCWCLLTAYLIVADLIDPTNGTCSQTQFDNCVSNLVVDYPCTPSEFDSYCSNFTVARQCLDSIKCAESDIGYTEIKKFGNFSNYLLQSNAIDSSLMLCADKSELSNQTHCVLQYIYPIDLNAVSWIGDHCGFLSAYYGFMLFSSDNIAQIVVNATIKRYELQQSKCPPFDWVLPYNVTIIGECFNATEAPPGGCSAAELDHICSTYAGSLKCFSNIGLATWDLGFSDEDLPDGRYIPIVYINHDISDANEYICAQKSVINSTCIFDDEILADFQSVYGNRGSYSTYEEFCGALRGSVDTIEANFTNKYDEEISTIIVTYLVKSTSYFGCYKDDFTVGPGATDTTAVKNRSPDFTFGSGSTFTTAANNRSPEFTIAPDTTVTTTANSRSSVFTMADDTTTANNLSAEITTRPVTTATTTDNSRPPEFTLVPRTTTRATTTNNRDVSDGANVLPLTLLVVVIATVSFMSTRYR